VAAAATQRLGARDERAVSNGSSVLLALLAATILSAATLANEAWAATGSTAIERAPSSWESFGSGLKLPQDAFDPATPIKPDIHIRLSSSAQPKLTIGSHSQSQ
jgi:hypothetical protein